MMMEVTDMRCEDDALVIVYNGREIRVEAPFDPCEVGQQKVLELALSAGQTEDDLSDEAMVAGLCMVKMGIACRIMISKLNQMQAEIDRLNAKVDELIDENDELRRECGEPPLFDEPTVKK